MGWMDGMGLMDEMGLMEWDDIDG